MKKRTVLTFAVLLIVTSLSHAQEVSANWDSVYDRWDVAISLSGGLSYAFRPAAYPQIDLIVSSIKVDDFMPLDFGVSARSVIAEYTQTNPDDITSGWLHWGIGLAATAHLSFNNLRAHSLPFMENFDFYVVCGPVYDIIYYSGEFETNPPPIPANGLGITTAGGARYFFLDWLAANIEVFNWGFSSGITAGLTFNF